MANLSGVLAVIAVLLFMVWWKLDNIDKRLKDRFPTEKEMDYELSQTDPGAHYDKHKHDKNK